MTDYFVIEPCTSARGIEIKLKEKRLDLKKAEAALTRSGEVVASSPVVLLVKFKGLQISIYGSGRMMIKGVKRTETKRVEALARELLDVLERGGAVG
jgi:hypothetical protein